MPRLRNIHSGAVVSVSEEKAGRLGAEWQPVEVEKAPAKKAASRKSSK